MIHLIVDGGLVLASFGAGWWACRKFGTQAAQVAQVVDSVVPGAKL